MPPGLDWDAWQVDAPKKPFKQGYTSFRAWWEYGSGLVGDWGAHHIDVANWFMDADAKQPLKTTAVGFYSNPDDRSRVRLQPVLDRLAVRQLHHVVRQRRLSAPELRRSEGAGHRRLGRLLLRQQRDTAGEPHGLGAPAAMSARRAIAFRPSRHPGAPAGAAAGGGGGRGPAERRAAAAAVDSAAAAAVAVRRSR